MYVLVYAPHGIVGEDGSWVELFDSYEEAHERMRVCVYTYPERDSLSEVDIDEWHATTYVSDPDGPEWHIYQGVSMRFNANDRARFKCIDSEWKDVGAIGCTIIRPLTNEEADLNETGPMYRIRLDKALNFGNGEFDTYSAFEDELEAVE